MKRFFTTLCVLACVLSSAAFAQTYATVTATVTDPNSNPYAGAQYSLVLADVNGNSLQNALISTGAIFNGSPIRGNLTSAGTLSVSLIPNSQLTTIGGAATRWQINIAAPTDSAILTFAPAWTIYYLANITGSVSLSSQLSALGSPITFVNLRTGQSTIAGSGSTVNLANGIVTGTGTGSTNSAATYAQIVALFSGCSGAQYLGYDGACHTASSATFTAGAIQYAPTSSTTRAVTYSDIFALFSGCSGTQYPGFDGACHTPSAGTGSTGQYAYFSGTNTVAGAAINVGAVPVGNASTGVTNSNIDDGVTTTKTVTVASADSGGIAASAFTSTDTVHNSSWTLAYNGTAPTTAVGPTQVQVVAGHTPPNSGGQKWDIANAPLAFQWPTNIGSLTALSTTITYGVAYFPRGGTIESITGVNAGTFTCGTNPTFNVEDCGASATTCASPTSLGSVTLTAANTLTAGTVTTASITAGHYLTIKNTAGACTVADPYLTVEYY